MRRTSIPLLVLALMLGGCLYLPRTTTYYNQDCEVEEHHMTLEEYQVASLGGCRNEGCVVLLAAVGVVSAASAVVSGSVVLTGNVVYWLEKKGNCFGHDKKD